MQAQPSAPVPQRGKITLNQTQDPEADHGHRKSRMTHARDTHPLLPRIFRFIRLVCCVFKLRPNETKMKQLPSKNLGELQQG